MKTFEHKNAGSFDEAVSLLKSSEGKAKALSGGTDILGVLKDELLEDYPEVLVNLKDIPGYNKIEDNGDELVLGAGAKLSDLAKLSDWPAISQAARSVASPLIRSTATIGGNLCQDVRCWYYRYPDSIGNTMNCKRKGGDTCYAINGENKYHSIFGGMHPGAEGCGSSCQDACPASTDIPLYMAKIREGHWDEAADIIMAYNPMPMITSRICPHPCQDDCNQRNYGDSVGIHCVERTLGDYILKDIKKFYKAPDKESGKVIAIIGAGPSGLAAAYYLRKAGNKVVIYDKMLKAGGVLQYGIPHYRLPKDIVDSYTNALSNMGVEFKLGVNVGETISIEDIRKHSDKIFFGTGAWKQPILGLEGENLTQFGLNFLVEVNTYLKKTIGNDVLVCGGGNVAMDVALTAVRLGAKSVKLVCLEKEEEMPAAKEEIARAKEEGVIIFDGWGLSKIIEKDGKVSSLEAKKCMTVFDDKGRFSPVYDESDKKIIDSDFIILATGQRVDLSFLGDKLSEQLSSERGLIDADVDSYRTKDDGFYAGGDVVTGPDIAIRAIKAGRVAAENMNKDMNVEIGSCSGCNDKFITFDIGGIKDINGAKLNELPPEKRTLTDEDESSLMMEDAVKEASRCMHCGCYAVNPSDISPVLILAGAVIVTTERTISAEELFASELTVQDVLNDGELIKEIRIPKSNGKANYDKRRVRDAIDFAIVSLASDIDVKNGVIEDAGIVFGAVAPVPCRLEEVEDYLKGKKADKKTAAEAKEIAVKNTHTMDKNEYKVFMMADMLEAAILRAAE